MVEFRDPGTCAWCLVAMEDGYAACPVHLPREGACPVVAKGSMLPHRPGYVHVLDGGHLVWREVAR